MGSEMMPHQHVDCLWAKEALSFNICLLQREKKVIQSLFSSGEHNHGLFNLGGI